MEEAEDVLGLGLSAGFKFNPEDDELVEYFLLRRLLGQQLPLEGMIFEDDPLSAPPWELLDKHKPKMNEGFFFANGQSIHGEGGRQRRTCVGRGCWQGQKPVVDGDRLRVPDGGSGMESEITWKKYMLNFHLDGQKGSTGWVMHEYSITEPAHLASSSLRLYRVRFSGYGGSAMREPEDYAQARAERDLLQEQSSASNSVFPRVDPVDDEDGGSAPSCSDQDYQCQYQYQYQHQQYSCQDSFFLSGADYAGPSTHQDLVDGSRMNLGAHSAAPSSVQGQGAPGVMDAAAPAWMLPQFGQESFDESFMDFELPENVDELLSFLGPCGSEAPLHDQLM